MKTTLKNLWPAGLLLTFLVSWAIFGTIQTARSAVPAPLPPTNNTGFVEKYKTGVPAMFRTRQPDTADANACVPPGGSVCDMLMAQVEVSAWSNVTVYVEAEPYTGIGCTTMCTGAGDTGPCYTDGGCWSDAGLYAGDLNSVYIEASPDGTRWEVVYAFDGGVPQGKVMSANYMGHYNYLRVEGRSTTGATCRVFLSGLRP